MKYLSHEKLGITFQEFGALLAVRAMLASGVLKHTDKRSPSSPDAHEFNMGTTCNAVGCGTVGCIGGTMAFIMGMEDPAAYVEKQEHNCAPLFQLFYPQGGKVMWNYDEISPKVSVAAIDNFLTTRDPKWQTVLPKKLRD